MTYSDLAQLIDAFRTRYRSNEISEVHFRSALARNGFNATEIDQEIKTIKEELNDEYRKQHGW